MTAQATGAGKPKTADMHPGPGFRVRAEIDRPSPEVVTGLGEFETPAISDRLNRLHTMQSAISNLTNEHLKILGPACTVKTYPGVSQFWTTLSAIGSVLPASRTAAARSAQGASGIQGDVHIGSSRSTRSGACAPIHMAIIPPSDTPPIDARSIASRSSRATTSRPRSSISYGPGATGDSPWPRWS